MTAMSMHNCYFIFNKLNGDDAPQNINFSSHYVPFLVPWNVRKFASAYGVPYSRYSASGVIYVRM